MFDVSFTELLVIGVVALVVIGPERLPKVARTVGHLVGRAQRYVNDVKSDIQREVELDELRKLKDQMQDAAQTVQTSLNQTESALRKPLESFEQDTMATLNEAKSLDAMGAQPASAPAEAVRSDAVQSEPAQLQAVQSQAVHSEAVPQVAVHPEAVQPAPAQHAPVTLTDSPSALAQAAAADPTPAAELANAFETPVTPKQLVLDGVVSGPIPEALSHAERAALNASAQAAAATPKPGTPT